MAWIATIIRLRITWVVGVAHKNKPQGRPNLPNTKKGRAKT